MSDGAAEYDAALRFYGAGNAPDGLAALGRAARAGWRPALTELGARLAVGAGAPRSPGDGDKLLAVAAQAGDAVALRYRALLTASGVTGEPCWEAARSLLAAAAAAGDEQAAVQLPWFDTLWRRALPGVKWLSETPRVAMVPGFMPPDLCRWLIRQAPPELAAAEVTDGATGQAKLDPARTNRMAQVLLFDMPLALLWLREEMASLTGTSASDFEIMNLLRYEPGQQFRRHHDYLDPDRPGFADELAERGQRTATFLVYLNDDFEGGETEFLASGQRFRGGCGDGLFFFNVHRDGTVDRASEHAGLPPSRGTKWLLSQWIRDRGQPVR